MICSIRHRRNKVYFVTHAAESTSSEAAYYPALDGLRAIATISVFLGHFASKGLAGLVCYGDAGVIVFFVLSGFLITSILLGSREQPKFRLVGALKNFYVRRSLRIFPLYYAAILLCAALGEPHVRQSLLSLLIFNLPGIPPVMGDYGPLAHFWSLFVEEQFYLIWPLLILTTPKAWLLPLLLVVPAVSLIAKYTMALAGHDYRWVFSSVFCCADHLGAGALLAYAVRYRSAWMQIRNGWIILAFIPVIILSYMRMSQQIDGWYSGHLGFGCLMHSAWTLAGVALVAILIKPPHGLAWLASSPLTFLGRISYGIYVYHFIVPYLQDRLSLGHLATPWMELGYKGLLTLGLATVSWYLLESPCLALKARLAPSHRDHSDQLAKAVLATAPSKA